MLTALAPPALLGFPGRLPAAPARRQDSSDSSGSYHTAPGSPEPPDFGPDAEGPASWPKVAPAPGAGAQPRLSVSAQNSRQQHRLVSGFQRGPGSGPLPLQPQLRTLPSGEMEVIFNAGPLFSSSDVADREVQQLTAQAFRSLSPPRPATPAPDPPQPQAPDPLQPQAPDGGARWATYLELRAHGPSPTAPAQFECVEVALEERVAPAKSRTVPKRQIELRPRPQSPPRAASAQHPRLLLRTGSLDESLGRLQAAAGLVQTALARKLCPAPPAQSTTTSSARQEPATQETARSAQGVLEEARFRPPRVHDGCASARAPRPWPSLRERAIRRDKPAPGTEPLGPVSSSIFLQSEEKIQEAHHRAPKTQFPREITDPARSLPFQVKPRSPSPPWEAPNWAMRGSRCPPPQALSLWDPAVQSVKSPSVPEASNTKDNRNPAVEETVSRGSPSPPTVSRWNQGVARTKSPSLKAPSLWEVPHPAVRDTVTRRGSPSPPALPPWEAPDQSIEEPWSPSPQETWPPTVQRSSRASTQEALNGVAQEEQAQSTPSTSSSPGTPDLTEAQSLSTQEIPDPAFPGTQPSPEFAASEPHHGLLVSSLNAEERPEALGPGEEASGRQRVAIPRPRDVRKMVKTTYAPSFPARTPGLGLPVSPAHPHVKEDGTSKTQELETLKSPAQAHYTSIFLKDFLPVVSHPYEPPGPSPSFNTVSRDPSQPNGVPRRRAENNTAKPFARTEIRLPGALALCRRPDRTPAVQVHVLGGDNPDAEQPQPLVPDGEGRISPPGGARTSPQRSPVEPLGTHPLRPPSPSSPQAHPSSGPGVSPKLETPSAAHEPAAAIQPPLSRETQALASRTAPAQPRAASAPPMDRPPEGFSQGARRPPGAAHLGKVLVDPESGRYYYVEAPRQPRLRLLFDPESGQYVEVLLPPSPLGPPRQVYSPLALGPSLYPPAYGPVSGLSLRSSPGLPALSSPQLPWASEVGPLDRMYYLPVSGAPSPAPPLLLCAPPSNSGPAQEGKDSLFPV
ncbi:proline-rich basic protein 1 [Orycteropus afer afer]|uniref:Proline-rich basic protein 1 n=1 Tax=Orycteropus afer afer TaxID=1230840 RepID=A0A8B6ZPY2_ORYAF|nr:proline-rich basic protein 1 [Orycteropus afer afer]